MIKSIYLTFDVEPFWTNIPERYDRSAWDLVSDESSYYTRYFVDYCLQNQINATFFIVGEWARRNIDVVKYIAKHKQFEIGCHSYWHEDMSLKSECDFLHDVVKGKELLESITERPIVRFRAPSFSIRNDQFQLLQSAGYTIDSSVTKATRLYGTTTYPLTLPTGLTEIPFEGCKIKGREITLLGGGYLRIVPLNLLRYMLHFDLGNMIYIHPSDLPKSIANFKYLTYTENLRKKLRFGSMMEKLKVINQKYTFCAV